MLGVMEDGFTPEHHEEFDPGRELNMLIHAMGFVETPQMIELREYIIKELHEDDDLEELREFYTEYVNLARAASESASGNDPTSKQADQMAYTGSLLAIAKLWRDYGDRKMYFQSLEDASEYAYGYGFHDTSERIVRIIQEEQGDEEELE
jgi:hypothetical protein